MMDLWGEGWDDWENEGGKPNMDADWEPSESESFTINVTTKLNVEQVKYKFTCMVADAIRHVKKFFFNRAEIATEPTTAQQIGEFVTEIRRLLRSEYADLADCGFRDLTNTDMWYDAGVPNVKNNFRWNYHIATTTGVLQINHALATTLCENASKMATSNQTIDEEFREINNSLNALLREQTALDTLVYKARDLNMQSGVVVDNLCGIAEKLQELPNG